MPSTCPRIPTSRPSAVVLSLCLVGTLSGFTAAQSSFDPSGSSLDSESNASFIRGDVDNNGFVQLVDVTSALSIIYEGLSPACADAVDADDNGILGLLDVIQVLSYLFGLNAPLPVPFPTCGPDPTSDGLGCSPTDSGCLPTDPAEVFRIQNYVTVGDSYGIEFRDFDGDGFLDLVSTANAVTILRGRGDGSFEAPSPNDNPFDGLSFWRPSAKSLAFGDLNDDGRLDIVTTSFEGIYGALSLPGGIVHQQNPNQTLTYDLASLERDEYVQIGDVDNDGWLDLVSFGDDANGSRELRIRGGLGDGTFEPPTTVATDPWPAPPVLDDFDNDGDLDIAYVQYPGTAVDILLNDGTGGYGSTTAYLTAQARRIEPVSLNGDSLPDLAIFDFAGQIELVVNLGNAVFALGDDVPTAPAHSDVVVGDLDGDADVEVITSDFLGRLTIYEIDATGLLALSSTRQFGAPIYDLELTDLDGDAVLDLGLGFGDRKACTVLLGNGDRTFQGAEGFNAPGRSSRTHVADFDVDGLPDLATLSDNGDVDVLLSNGDGSFQVQSTFGTTALTVIDHVFGDIDGDLDLDVVALLLDSNDDPRLGTSLASGFGVGAYSNFTLQTLTVFGGRRLELGDADSDGDLDLLIGQSDGVSIQLNDGTGTFGSTTWLASSFNGSLALGDVDSDGDLDLVTLAGSFGVRLLRGDGAGNFVTEFVNEPSFLDTTLGATLALADVDGDSDLDLLLGGMDGELRRYPNDGTGHFLFRSTSETTTYSTVTGAAVGDIDLDGRSEVITGFRDRPFVGLWRAGEVGVLRPPTTFASPSGIADPVLADFDGDGDLDLASFSETIERVLYLENQLID